jgi:hypothetical protein
MLFNSNTENRYFNASYLSNYIVQPSSGWLKCEIITDPDKQKTVQKQTALISAISCRERQIVFEFSQQE